MKAKALSLLFAFLLILVSDWAQAASPTGIMPRRSKRHKPRRPPVSRVQQRAPKYEAALPPPNAAQMQEILADQKPGSPTEIAAQGLTGMAPCSDTRARDAEAQAAALMAKVQALYAEILKLSSRSYAASVACAYPNYNCTEYNYIIKRLGEINKEVLALVPQAQALAAMAGGSGGGNCAGGASPLALPPSMNRDAVAKKFGFKYPGGGGGGYSGGGGLAGLSGGAFEQLQELADMDGTEAGWAMDGRGRIKDFTAKVGKYQQASVAAAALGGRSEYARRRMEELKDDRKGDPSAEAEYDYYKINYKELGAKYDALAGERSQAAMNVAQDALGAPAVSVASVVPNPGEKPLLASLKDAAVDIVKEQAQETFDEKKDEAIESVLESICGERCAKSVMGVRDITQAAVENVKFDQDWTDAIKELGSGTTSTVAIDKLMAKLDEGLFNVGDKSKDALKNVFGGE